MLKRLLPLLCILLSGLLDTAVIPAIYYGHYLIPVTLVVVILIGIQLGRMRGMLFGLIAGLISDITCGSLGLKLFPYIGIGFLIGFLLDQQPETSAAKDSKERFQLIAIRAIWIAVLVLLYEIVMLVYQYFSNAVLLWQYFRDLLIRTAMATVLSLLLYNPMRTILVGGSRKNRKTREVKRF